ncbi:predicted protein [Sclerotinia sclerotiorum 1980 UF-70]|uniref:Uncharacterized protein n=2 Tax=Sclerotinia sclerotiorum (strain ATCC 18683 / 1980 / Ss-1) TaxID=665079 RepID=A7ETY6_SCLS1|nr:predicted protein [Sclerotinia sclerotiorum 1980 UF-70]APA15184.1 hypothetical protein sscle_14g099540 [Sclerotinia sclerotiorum 1980 UF-70]EDN92928.1 predicted protein [Sclerotinia sclerotiorum 1980 UF-70]
MFNFTVHFNHAIIRGDRILIRATYGSTPFHLGDLEGHNVTGRVVPTPSGGIELFTVRLNGQVVAFEFDSFNALEFHEFISSQLPPALRPAPLTGLEERIALLLSRHAN